MYKERHYRQFSQSEGLFSFVVRIKETDLFISARQDLSLQARALVRKLRSEIEAYISQHPSFATTLVPMKLDAQAPAIVRRMLQAAQKAGVGPMAAVAGAIAQEVAKALSSQSHDLLVENGGDIFIYTTQDRVLGIWAGQDNPFNAYSLQIKAAQSPLSVCCSSGTVSHSLSYGKADAAIVLAQNGALADAVATALGNRVQTYTDFETALAYAKNVHGVLGALIIQGDKMAAWGCVQIC